MNKVSKKGLYTKHFFIYLSLLVTSLVSSLIATFFPEIARAEWFDMLFFLLKVVGMVSFIVLCYHILVYKNYFGFDRISTVSLFIGAALSIVFMFIDMNLTLFEPIKEFSLDVRFRLSTLQLVPEDISAGVIKQKENPNAHNAIQIIGIDNATINEYMGFPFSWKYYARLLQSLEESKVRTIMFDIFLLDQMKNRFDPSKGKKGELSYYFEKFDNIIANYPFETKLLNLTAEQKKVYEEKMKYFVKNEVKNVIHGNFDNYPEWVRFPEIPILSISKHVEGIGYANIRRQNTGVNRTLPIVAKWKGKIYPSAVLLVAVNYFGVNLQKDIEVKLGSYVKIKNIPKKTIGVFKKDDDGFFVISPNGGLETIKIDVMHSPNPERTITIPIDKEGFMHINFIGGPWSFRSIPFNLVASAEKGFYSAKQDSFKDKILLVATYYASGVAHDIHASPFGTMAGVEHHANALNTVLMQDFLVYAPRWVNYIIYMLIGLSLAFLAPRFKILPLSLAILAVSILFAFVTFFNFTVFNIIHIFFIPYIQVAVVTIAVTGYKAFSEEEKAKHIKSTFSKFVAEDVMDKLLSDPDTLQLGGEEKDVTIFFSDIRGFTSIAESLPPKELVKFLNEYLSKMTEICLAYRGTIDKYMGDAIMAFWGAPLSEKDHAYLACLASVSQFRAFQKLQEKWIAEGKPPIGMGIGLNSGRAIVGNIGSSRRMDYTVVGDPVNLSSRLEGTNKIYSTNIIISKNTYEQVKDRVISRELDIIRVKGKSEPICIYELIDIKDGEDMVRYLS